MARIPQTQIFQAGTGIRKDSAASGNTLAGMATINGNPAAGSVMANMPILKSPRIIPTQIVLTGSSVAAAGTTKLFLGDATGQAEAFGLVGGAGAVEMDVTGAMTATILKKWLQTYALVIGAYNFKSTAEGEMNNNLSAVYSTIDGKNYNKILFSSGEESNMQFNAKLLNPYIPFVMTNETALTIPITEVAGGGTTITDTFTLKIAAAVPYGQLDDYLAQAGILDRSPLGGAGK